MKERRFKRAILRLLSGCCFQLHFCWHVCEEIDLALKLREQIARKQNMDAAISIDELRNPHIRSDAAESVGIVERHSVNALEKADHAAHGNARGIIEIFVKTHRHEMV